MRGDRWLVQTKLKLNHVMLTSVALSGVFHAQATVLHFMLIYNIHVMIVCLYVNN